MEADRANPSEAESLEREAGGTVGVIDIGSNSIRLVIFDAVRRSPIALFNEKVLCGIGRRVGSTGQLDPDGLVRAREALARFRSIAAHRGASRLIAVATAAVRDAKNGPGFVEEATRLCGVPVRVLSGEEEALLSAQGVLSGIPDAEGLVGDLGGGSLELIELVQGRCGRAATLPLGPLRLMDLGEDKMSVLRDRVDAELAQISWLPSVAGKPFYAVGGAWRNIARLHMGQWSYPLHILQHYEIEGEQALRFARLVAGLGRKSLQSMAGISRRRIDTIPHGALVLERLIADTKVNKIVVSANGLREGLLFALLTPEERARDPLIEAARALAQGQSRNPAHGEELARWIMPLFPTRNPAQQRLITAAALLSDTHWRTHPDYRAEHAFLEIKRAQFGGITHAERAFLALCVYHRYGGTEDQRTDVSDIHPIAGDDGAGWADTVGKAVRLGYTLSASATGVLPRCTLTRTDSKLVLGLPQDLIALVGESVRKRLDDLAKAMGSEHKIEVRD